jgi:hypothetical protein
VRHLGSLSPIVPRVGGLSPTVTPTEKSAEEVENAARGHVKCERRTTTKGSYKNRLTGYTETSEYILLRDAETTPEPLGEVR